MNKFVIGATSCALSILIGGLFSGGVVKAGIVTDRFPIQMYVDHQLDTYTHAGDSRRAGWADANTDLIKVNSVSNGWAYVSHPGRGGTVNRYCRVNELFADPNYSNRTARVKGVQSAYRTSSGSATIGSVSNNEEVTVLADNGSRAQIIYRLDNGSGYKVGWVPSSSVQGGASSGGASSKGNGDVDGDGQITKSDVDMLLAYIQGKRGALPRRDNADLNGDGSIDIFDVTAVNNILRNSAAQTRPSQSNVSTVNSQRVITNNTISVRTAGIANGWYKIHPAHDMGRALDALGVATSNGNNLHMWSNANVPQQKFYLENRGNNWFSLRTGYGSGLYVTAVGSGNGANLEMKPWSGSSYQMFQLVNGGNVNGKTVYHIIARVGSNLNFDCAGGGRSDGNNAQLWTKETGSSWHKWYFEPVSANSGNTTTNNRVNSTTSLVGKTVAAKRGVNAYRYSNLTTKIGSVYAGDSCKVVREGSNAYYVQYPISKRPFYKFGWVAKNIFESQAQPITKADPVGKETLSSLINKWDGQDWNKYDKVWPSGENATGSECFGFANYIFKELHGVYAGSGVGSTHIISKLQSGVYSRYTTIRATMDDMHNVFCNNIKAGDFIQGSKGTKDSQHSMIFVSYDANKQNLMLLDSNWSTDHDNKIRYRSMLLSKFISRFPRVSIYTK